jgi:CheY-like chemotaxis protein
MRKCKLNLQVVLMADDDNDDCLLVKMAFEESSMDGELRFVEDGEALLDYLYRRGEFANTELPRPWLILLDLNMPRKDGREVLRAIKSDPLLKTIPVIILSTSDEPDDIKASYELGASSYITKPGSFDGLVEMMESIRRYWFSTVKLPCTVK